MNYYILFITSLFIFNCSSTENVSLDRGFSEIGVISFSEENNQIKFDIYLLSHTDIRGVELKIDSDNYLQINDVQSEKLKGYDFNIHNNKQGKIIAFSLKGKEIPKSTTLIKEKNILFSIQAERLKEGTFKIQLNPVLAVSNDGKTEKIQTKEIEFEWLDQ